MILLTHIIHPFIEALQRKFSMRFLNHQEPYYPPEKPHCASFTVPPWLYDAPADRHINALDYFLKKYGRKSGAAIRLNLNAGYYLASSDSSFEMGMVKINTYSVEAECDLAADPAVLKSEVEKMCEELGSLAGQQSFLTRDFNPTAEQIERSLRTTEPESAAA